MKDARCPEETTIPPLLVVPIVLRRTATPMYAADPDAAAERGVTDFAVFDARSGPAQRRGAEHHAVAGHERREIAVEQQIDLPR